MGRAAKAGENVVILRVRCSVEVEKDALANGVVGKDCVSVVALFVKR